MLVFLLSLSARGGNPAGLDGVGSHRRHAPENEKPGPQAGFM